MNRQKAACLGAFLLFATATGLSLCLMVPPGHVPDERNHVLRADSLLHAGVLGKRGLWNNAPASLLRADPAMLAVITLPEQPLLTAPQPYTPAMQAQAARATWQGAHWIEAGAIAGYSPVFYLPAAAGIGIAQLTGAAPLTAFFAGRLVNLATFLVLMGLSIAIARRGYVLIACLGLLPMTLALAASCSQDGLLFASTALAIACLSRVMHAQSETPPATQRWRGAASLLLAAVVAAKPPYAPLVLLLLLPLRAASWRTLSGRLGLAVCALLPGLLWSVFDVICVATSPLRSPQEAGPLWPGANPARFEGSVFAAQLRVLMAHPILLLSLPAGALRANAGALLHQVVGVLDYLCLFLPRPLYPLWIAALTASCLAERSPSLASRLGVLDRLVVGTVAVLAVLAVCLALYVQWTPVGVSRIGGLQGRYFLPLIPLAVFLMPSFGNWSGVRILCLTAAATDVVWLPFVVRHYYQAE